MTLYEMCVVVPTTRLPPHRPFNHLNRVAESLFDMLVTEVKQLRGESLVTANKLVNLLSTGFRPIIPDYVPPTLASLITQCWKEDSAHRPSFINIHAVLSSSAMFEDIHRQGTGTGTLGGLGIEMSLEPYVRNGGMRNI